MLGSGVSKNELSTSLNALQAMHARLSDQAVGARLGITRLIEEIQNVKSQLFGFGSRAEGSRLADRAKRALTLEARIVDVVKHATHARELAASVERELAAGSIEASESVRADLQDWRKQIEIALGAQLGADELELATRDLRDVSARLDDALRALKALAKGHAALATLDDATGFALRELVAQLDRAVIARKVTPEQLQQLDLAVASHEPKRPIEPSPAIQLELRLDEIDRDIFQLRRWELLFPGLDPQPLRAVSLQQELEHLRDRPSLDTREALAERLRLTMTRYREHAAATRDTYAVDLSERLRILGVVDAGFNEFATRFDPLRTMQIREPQQWETFARASDELRQALDDRMELFASRLAEAAARRVAALRNRLAGSAAGLRTQALARELDEQEKTLRGLAVDEPSPPAVRSLNVLRALDGLDSRFALRAAESAAEVTALRTRLERVARAAAGLRSVASTLHIELLVDRLVHLQEELDAENAVLDPWWARADEAEAEVEAAVEYARQYLMRLATELATNRADAMRELDLAEAPEPPASPGWPPDAALDGDSVDAFISAVAIWRKQLQQSYETALDEAERHRDRLCETLSKAAELPDLSEDDRTRITELCDTAATRGPDATRPIVERLRWHRYWRLEAQGLVDDLHRDEEEARATVETLRARLRKFRDRGLHEYWPDAMHRLMDLVEGLPKLPLSWPDHRRQAEQALKLLRSLEEDGLRRASTQTAQELGRLRRFAEQKPRELRDNDRRLLRELDALPADVLPDLALRRALTKAVRRLAP
jgi:hypothetical protein